MEDSQLFTFRVTRTERELIDRRAAACGMSRSALIRYLLRNVQVQVNTVVTADPVQPSLPDVLSN